MASRAAFAPFRAATRETSSLTSRPRAGRRGHLGSVVFVSIDPVEPLMSALGELPDVMARTGYTFPFDQDED